MTHRWTERDSNPRSPSTDGGQYPLDEAGGNHIESLREVVATVIDQSSVSLNLDVEELDLSLDQKSVIAMLVTEVANNSAKHVFERNLGSRFEVALLAIASETSSASSIVYGTIVAKILLAIPTDIRVPGRAAAP
jgi:two-component sensor histidine kinase